MGSAADIYPNNLNPFDSSSSSADSLYDESKNPFNSGDEDEEARDQFPVYSPPKPVPVPAPRKKLLESLDQKPRLSAELLRTESERLSQRPYVKIRDPESSGDYLRATSDKPLSRTESIKRKAPSPPKKPVADMNLRKLKDPLPFSEEQNLSDFPDSLSKPPLANEQSKTSPSLAKEQASPGHSPRRTAPSLPAHVKGVTFTGLHSTETSASGSLRTSAESVASSDKDGKAVRSPVPVSALRSTMIHAPCDKKKTRKSLTYDLHRMGLPEIDDKLKTFERYARRIEEEYSYITLRARQDFANCAVPTAQADPNGRVVRRMRRLLEAREAVEEHKARLNLMKSVRILELRHEALQKRLRKLAGVPFHQRKTWHEVMENKLVESLLKNIERRESLLDEEDYQMMRRMCQLQTMAESVISLRSISCKVSSASL